MALVHLRCQTCGTQAEADLGETELQRSRAQGYVSRFCNRCRGQARWQIQQSSSTSFRSEYVTPAAPLHASVLLIDDDESILKVLQKALSNEELELDVANSGRKAVQFLTRGDYDLILSDIRMPEFDGKQLFAFLDQNLPQYKAKVIFLTGDTGNPETMRFLEETQCSYLTKPVDIPALLALLRRRLSAR